MTNLTTFNYLSNTVRVVEIDGQPWFLATDVCKALGYAVSVSGVNHYLVGLGEGIDRRTMNARTLGIFEGIRGNPMRSFITEAGLYRIAMRAQTERPEVVKFQEWVTREVLPAIRKDGMYVAGEEKLKTGEMSEDELILRAHQLLMEKVERYRREKEEAERKLEMAEPLIRVGENVERYMRTVSQAARNLTGVNSNAIKGDLFRAGYLYKTPSGTYRVYSRYRTTHFVERWNEYGKTDIHVAPKGYEVLDQLHREGRLTKLKAYT